MSERYVHPWGVGMPAWLRLHDFGRVVREAFGHDAYLVGSATGDRAPRDVDIRVELPIDDYLVRVGPAEECGKPGTRWAAFALAFSALGREMTGLAIDFQIQTSAHAAVYRDEPRREIGSGR